MLEILLAQYVYFNNIEHCFTMACLNGNIEIVKILLTVFIVGLVFSAIPIFIPSAFTTNIDNAIVS